MDQVTASLKTWAAFNEAERYLREDILRQINSAESFSGDDMHPLHALAGTVREMEPFLPHDLVNAANQALQNLQVEMNYFIDCCRAGILLRNQGNPHEEATHTALTQLERTFLVFKHDLNQIAKLLPMHQSSKNTPIQSVNMIFNGSVTGITGLVQKISNNINDPDQQNTLAEIDKNIEHLLSFTENGGGFGDPDAKEAHERKIQVLLSLRQQEILRNQKTIMGNSINQYGLGDNIAGDKVMGDKIETQINNSQDLSQAAKEIKSLLEQLSLEYPTDSHRVLGAKAVDQVEKNPELKSRLLRGIKAGSFAALEKMIDHPVAQFFIKGAEEVLKP